MISVTAHLGRVDYVMSLFAPYLIRPFSQQGREWLFLNTVSLEVYEARESDQSHPSLSNHVLFDGCAITTLT